MKYALILLLAIGSYSANAQLFYFQANDTTCIFGDKINVRSQPKTDAAVAFQLVAGDLVILLEESTERSTLNKIDLPWYKIKTLAGQTGFVWGGLLSLWGVQQDGDVRFVAGVLQSDGKRADQDGVPTYTFEVRAVRNGTVLHKVSTQIQNEGSVHPISIEPGARGLKGYRDLLCLDIGFEACGYPQESWYILWDGQKLVPLPLCTSIADAGVFAHSERYIFPQSPYEDIPGHSGDDSLIYFCIEHYEEEELGEGNEGWNQDSWTRVRPMRWDGKQFLKPKDMGEPKE